MSSRCGGPFLESHYRKLRQESFELKTSLGRTPKQNKTNPETRQTVGTSCVLGTDAGTEDVPVLKGPCCHSLGQGLLKSRKGESRGGEVSVSGT